MVIHQEYQQAEWILYTLIQANNMITYRLHIMQWRGQFSSIALSFFSKIIYFYKRVILMWPKMAILFLSDKRQTRILFSTFLNFCITKIIKTSVIQSEYHQIKVITFIKILFYSFIILHYFILHIIIITTATIIFFLDVFSSNFY